jgi:hypothetical protein
MESAGLANQVGAETLVRPWMQPTQGPLEIIVFRLFLFKPSPSPDLLHFTPINLSMIT